nr:hypothetical protein [uncultured bacterium]
MSSDDPTLDVLQKQQFLSTQWSLVMMAQHRSSPDGRDAFARLCEKYWYPLYAHARRLEPDVHSAMDLIQGFFERVVERNYIADADPARGRFRTFLLTSLTNYIRNEWDKTQTIKRGGGTNLLSIDSGELERRFLREPEDSATPQRLFDRSWAENVLGRALNQLEIEYQQSGRGEVFAQLKQFLTAGTTERYGEVSERLEMSLAATKTAVHRLRSRYRERLCAEIIDTTADGDDVDDEIRCLFETFSRE